MPPLTAVILAGGQSSRMGQDKALLSLQGKPFIRCIYDAALGCSDRVIVVAPWPHRYHSCLPTSCHYVREALSPCMAEAAPSASQGPLVGFYQGLRDVKTDWVLLLACDLPRLQANHLRDWADQIDALSEQIIAFLPRQTKGWEPLCGFYHRRCRESIGDFIAAGGRSFQSWLQHQPVCPIPLSHAATAMLYNCNTPQDMAQIAADGDR